MAVRSYYAMNKVNAMNAFKEEGKRFKKWLGSAGRNHQVRIGADGGWIETALFDAWLAGQGNEVGVCINCKNLFVRRRSSRPRQYCDAERCQKIQKIKNSIVTCGNVPNYCSPYRCDIDYHGSPID